MSSRLEELQKEIDDQKKEFAKELADHLQSWQNEQVDYVGTLAKSMSDATVGPGKS